MYGPLWTYLGGAIGVLAGESLLVSVLLFKAVAALASLFCTYYAYRLALRWQTSRAGGAVVLLGWNPLVVLMVGSGHNDILLMAFVLAGLWLAAAGRPGWGLWLAGLSTLVKLATAPIMPVLAAGQLFRAGRLSLGRLALVLAAGLALAAATLALYAPLWPGLDHLGPLMRQGLFTSSPLRVGARIVDARPG